MQEYQNTESYTPPTPARLGLGIVLSIIFLLLVIMGLIAGWGTFLKSAPTLVQMLVYLVIFGLPLLVLYLCGKDVYTWLHQAKRISIETQLLAVEKAKAEEQVKDMQAARERDDLLAAAEAARIHAEAEKLLSTIEWDDQGNAARYDPYTRQITQLRGQMREYPALSSLNYRYDYKDTRVTEDKPGQLGAGIAQPSQDALISQLPENQLIVSPGVLFSNGQLVKVSIVDVPHFKILGSTGFGKSCLAGSLIDQATQTNSPDVFQLACLDLEHKTSRLFEDLPHIATCKVGNRLVQMVATDADEVVTHLGYLKRLLDYRAGLSEAELAKQPVMFMYVEEMLSLQYEVVDPKQLKIMLADLTILSVRGRKYGLFLLACMQTDYSTDEMRVSQKMFRFRAAAAIDQSAARAAGFQNTDLIKQNFAQGQPGQFVIEYPSFSQIVLAPVYDVKRLVTQKTAVRETFADRSNGPKLRIVNAGRTVVEPSLNGSQNGQERALEANIREVRKYKALDWGKEAIIEKVWNVKKGGSTRYKQAEAEYHQIVAMIEEEESEA